MALPRVDDLSVVRQAAAEGDGDGGGPQHVHAVDGLEVHMRFSAVPGVAATP